MKRNVLAFVLGLVVLLTSCSAVSTTSSLDFSSFSDDELISAYQAILSEASQRGLSLSAQTNSLPEEPAQPMVWIPKSGHKYHSISTCSNMKNPSQVTLSMAIDLGYTACSKCDPP